MTSINHIDEGDRAGKSSSERESEGEEHVEGNQRTSERCKERGKKVKLRASKYCYV